MDIRNAVATFMAKVIGLDVIDLDCNGFICAYNGNSKEIVLACPREVQRGEFDIDEEPVDRHSFEKALDEFITKHKDNDCIFNSYARCDIISILMISDDRGLVRHTVDHQFGR